MIRPRVFMLPFKADWEKSNESHSLAAFIIENMVALAYPGKKLIAQQIIAGGCANLNIKIQLEHILKPLILRIYLRDKDAAEREQGLAAILLPTVPVPRITQVLNYDGYRFAIAEFISGISLRELLLSSEIHNMGDIMYKVGSMLCKIAAHEFPIAGFFDKNLKIVKNLAENDYLTFAKECLRSDTVLTQLGVTRVEEINNYLNQYENYFPTEKDRQLVHADFDPANIMVDQINGVWEITGVLDWEFAFAGSVLCDVANMLRYTHQMPAIFEAEFLRGLNHGGIELPEHWKISVDLLNLISLLDCLAKADPQQRPKQCVDICALIEVIIKRLQKVNI